MFPALQGGFLTSGPPGKSLGSVLKDEKIFLKTGKSLHQIGNGDRTLVLNSHHASCVLDEVQRDVKWIV